MALLELSNVTRVYTSGGLLGRRHVHAVDGVSFVVGQDKPEIFAIIGESGSGKTTLARMMLNIVPPSAGSIRFRGRPPKRLRAAWISCARCSRSFRTRLRHSIH